MKAIDYATMKLKSVIATIDSVREMDFPYIHVANAVEFIRKHFGELEASLHNISSAASARAICKNVSEEIDKYLLAVGFMVRACNNQGALELQGPLLRLTHQALDPSVKLVISSEWEYSPYTLLYPGDFGNEYVLVGLPVSEAGNPLIAPLAGHELGHNIWRSSPKLQATIAAQIEEKVLDIIKNQLWTEYAEVFDINDPEDLLQAELFDNLSWVLAVTWGTSQCEEMFCDFIGVSIFGEAYLNAFQYLIAPGVGTRSPAYPSLRDRVNALLKASSNEKLKIAVPQDFQEEFDDSPLSFDPKQDLLIKISDSAAQALVPLLIAAATEFCEERKLINHDRNDVDRIADCFKRVVPATDATSLANIINAAWRLYLSPNNYWEIDYPSTKDSEKRYQLICELALKSFEVFEIEKIQG